MQSDICKNTDIVIFRIFCHYYSTGAIALINQFIENYKKKLTFYENLGRISSSQLEDALQSAGIRAMVTYRIKNPGRLKSKILRRNVKRTVPYKNMKEIYEDIADLCGIRVSLYFPGDRIKVDSLISDLFQVIERKQFPEQSKPPTYNKRFSEGCTISSFICTR